MQHESFSSVVQGCFLRLAYQSSKRLSYYIIAEVVGVRHQEKTYEFMNKTTNIIFQVKHEKKEFKITLDLVSNQPFEENE